MVNLSLLSMPKDLRDPDLIISVLVEKRLSNFLPWQGAPIVSYFLRTLYADFDEAALQEAILAYNRRHRRFGGV